MTTRLRAVPSPADEPLDIAACRNGHPRTPENTYVSPNGSATCSECRRASVRRYRAIRGIIYSPRDERPFEQRFWDKVDRRDPDECWVWKAGKSAFGHGKVWRDGRHEPAHRVAWELANGQLAGDRFVLHSCDNPPCCNPAHLRPGTQADNVADAVERLRFPCQRQTHCPRGHPYSVDNTYFMSRRDGRRARACRECRRAASKAWKSRQRNQSTCLV